VHLADRITGMRVAGLVAVLALALLGCDDGGSASDTTITMAQAEQQATERLTDAARRLDPDAELVALPDQDVACTGLSNDGPARLTIGRSFEVRGLDPTRADAYVELLRSHWKTKGYNDIDGSATYPLIRVEHPDDHFTLAFQVRNDIPTLSATLSCIWPDGTPPTR
jgi:hypothetical protein